MKHASERVSAVEQMSERSGTHKRSGQSKQMRELCERTDKRVAQYVAPIFGCFKPPWLGRREEEEGGGKRSEDDLVWRGEKEGLKSEVTRGTRRRRGMSIRLIDIRQDAVRDDMRSYGANSPILQVSNRPLPDS